MTQVNKTLWRLGDGDLAGTVTRAGHTMLIEALWCDQLACLRRVLPKGDVRDSLAFMERERERMIKWE